MIVSLVQLCIISAMLGRVNPRREGSSDDYLRELRYNHEDGEEK